MGKKQRQKEKVIKPPELPPEVPDDEIEVSDEDVQFISKHRKYAGFVRRLDTESITRHVSRIANLKEDELEKLYEKRQRNKPLEQEEEKSLQVDPVDALPVKTLDGKLYYRTAAKVSKKSEDGEDDMEGSGNDDGGNTTLIKSTKAERRAKLKKKKKDEKKQAKEQPKEEETQEAPQSKVLAEVKEELTAEEIAQKKKVTIADLGTALLSDPDSNIKSLKELLKFCKDEDNAIVKLALLSLLAVFRDIIPGYRIRIPTQKEMEGNISKAVKKTWFYESTLLTSYKVYLQRLVTLEEDPLFHRLTLRCLCTLLDAVPHFNFRENILAAVVRNIGSSDDVVRKLCTKTITSLFTNEGKHGGEATIEAVRLIADLVKIHNCQLHPDSIEVFLALSFDEDLGRSRKMDDDRKGKNMRHKKRKKYEKVEQVLNDKKKSRQELLKKTREEVSADFKAASFAPDEEERRRLQSDTLSAVFEIYFRILTHTVRPVVARSKGGGHLSRSAFGTHPLLAPCLKGLGKFSHLIDLDFMTDLMKYLKILAAGGSNSEGSEGHLTVSECLQCCMVAFKVMRKNLDALNVDLQDFFIQLYNLILEYRPGRDQGQVLAETLKIILCEDRQHDMQRAAAFIKRLATSSLCFGPAESMAALVTVKHLLQKNVKCRYMLENDAGGGSVSGSIARYQPYASDPHLSGALSSVLWELHLLSKHYHPSISTTASTISNMSSAHNHVYLSTVSPLQAFTEFSPVQSSFDLTSSVKKLSVKRKRGTGSLLVENGSVLESIDEDILKKKLADHFGVVQDIVENERLRRELDHATVSLKLYDQYKKHKEKEVKQGNGKQKRSE